MARLSWGWFIPTEFTSTRMTTKYKPGFCRALLLMRPTHYPKATLDTYTYQQQFIMCKYTDHQLALLLLITLTNFTQSQRSDLFHLLDQRLDERSSSARRNSNMVCGIQNLSTTTHSIKLSVSAQQGHVSILINSWAISLQLSVYTNLS